MEGKGADPVDTVDHVAAPVLNADELRLAQMGYKQELKRGMSLLTNFGTSFSIVSFMTSITGSFGIAWFYGGPVAMVWGWMIATTFTLTVGVAMAEICSSYPTSGGLYYWSAKLGGKHGVLASWLAGWFNLLGQIAITAGVGMACTNSIVAMAVMGTSPRLANQHGGASLATIANLAPFYGMSTNPLRPEPCPYDSFGNLVTSFVAGTVDSANNAFAPSEVAFDVGECTKVPWQPSQPKIFGLFVGVMALAALLNTFSIGALNKIVIFSIFMHICGSLVMTTGMPIIAKTHQNKKTIWGKFVPGNGNPVYNDAPSGSTIFEGYAGYGFVANENINEGGNGITPTSLGVSRLSTNAYIFFCGLLMSQWCYTGYDASAHMSEETHDAARSGPLGIVGTILVTFTFGLAYIVSFIASVPSMYNSYNGPFALSYNPAVQILWDLHEIRYSNGRYAMGMWIIPLVCQFCCTVSSITSNSRMLYAFSRDGAVPFSNLWHKISPHFQIPINAVWGMALAAVCIALPIVNSSEAFGAVTSIATIGLYVSYIIPIVCRMTVGRADFKPGPFFLGETASMINSAVATCWVIAICVFFTMPEVLPISFKLNENYAIIAVGVVLVYSFSTWFVPGPKPFGAKSWFKGPHLESLDIAAVADAGPGASMHGVMEGKPLPVPIGV